ncbi:dTDP-4-dehydrorhamnose 3,5-epimerase [bacterium]|nr:dTDP-4-dehydrorhamnose 3,5-epimerase [bacterium]
MKVEQGPIAGLLIVTPTVYPDDRGFFFESFNEARFRKHGIDLPWRQDNHVKSVLNTVRGLHFQRGEGQAKLVRCIRGKVWDVAVDIRPGSPTLGKWFGIELTPESFKTFFVPVGFAHGYAVLSDEAEVLYKCSKEYDPNLEDGFRWDDSDVAVQWPVETPILSKRDVTAQTFRELMAKMGQV